MTEAYQKRSVSFPAVVGKSPQILILGTLPGQESLRQKRYYAHPQNAFWKLLFQIFHTEFISDYGKRLTFLKENKIALWDVCQTGVRKGSLDSNIKQEIPNAIPPFIEKYPTIKTVFFNGKKAEHLFVKFFERKAHLNYITLLSTSPANATYSFEQKRENWRQIRPAAHP